jgi:lipoprotein-anchoring transpeptidase ErfK/SrfK
MQWRPKTYWQAGTKATVDMQIGGISTAPGTYFTQDGNVTYSFGQAHVLRVDLNTQYMQVFDGGQLVRTVPVSTGKPGHDTYTGTKVILDKLSSMIMDSSTYGVPVNSPEGYRLTVANAQRLTWDGEFIHAAPWSVADQGVRPVSHGCTNVSDPDGKWLFDFTQIGDPVEFTGGGLPYPPGVGIGVWTYSWDQWQTLSALHH